jgi:hypothetical protein
VEFWRGLEDQRSDRIYSLGNRGVKKGLGPRGTRDEEFLVPSLHQYMVGIIYPPGCNKVKVAAKTYWGPVPMHNGSFAQKSFQIDSINSCSTSKKLQFWLKIVKIIYSLTLKRIKGKSCWRRTTCTWFCTVCKTMVEITAISTVRLSDPKYFIMISDVLCSLWGPPIIK